MPQADPTGGGVELQYSEALARPIASHERAETTHCAAAHL